MTRFAGAIPRETDCKCDGMHDGQSALRPIIRARLKAGAALWVYLARVDHAISCLFIACASWAGEAPIARQSIKGPALVVSFSAATDSAMDKRMSSANSSCALSAKAFFASLMTPGVIWPGAEYRAHAHTNPDIKRRKAPSEVLLTL